MQKGPIKARSLRNDEGVDRSRIGIEIQGDFSRNGPGVDGRRVKNAGASGVSVEQILRPRRDSYAEKVIDDPKRFDAIEVHDVCEFSDPEGPSHEEPEYDRVAPSTFSVYAGWRSRLLRGFRSTVRCASIRHRAGQHPPLAHI
jgi:hypothetical protein